jgi:hypothetical protein
MNIEKNKELKNSSTIVQRIYGLAEEKQTPVFLLALYVSFAGLLFSFIIMCLIYVLLFTNFFKEFSLVLESLDLTNQLSEPIS